MLFHILPHLARNARRHINAGEPGFPGKSGVVCDAALFEQTLAWSSKTQKLRNFAVGAISFSTPFTGIQVSFYFYALLVRQLASRQGDKLVFPTLVGPEPPLFLMLVRIKRSLIYFLLMLRVESKLIHVSGPPFSDAQSLEGASSSDDAHPSNAFFLFLG